MALDKKIELIINTMDCTYIDEENNGFIYNLLFKNLSIDEKYSIKIIVNDTKNSLLHFRLRVIEKNVSPDTTLAGYMRFDKPIKDLKIDVLLMDYEDKVIFKKLNMDINSSKIDHITTESTNA